MSARLLDAESGPARSSPYFAGRHRECHALLTMIASSSGYHRVIEERSANRDAFTDSRGSGTRRGL
jgi:hypothetical protein